MIRLLFVNAHYYPDLASTGQHLTDLAEYLAGRGYDVSVLTSRGKYVAGRVEAPPRERRNGVGVTRARATTFGRGSHLGRLVDYASFYGHVLLRLLRSPLEVRVVFLTTPPLLAFVGRVARLLRGVRYGIWSMDLHPDAEFAAGMLDPRGLLGRFLEWANATGYRQADFVVDLGRYMKRRLVAKGVAPERMHTVHVWSRVEEIEPTPRDENRLLDDLELRTRFVVMYSGNAGLVHDFDSVLEAMRMLAGDPRIYFLFVGGGPQRKLIEDFASEHGVRNFSYRDYFPRGLLRYSLAAADVHLVTLRQPFAGIAVPGKLYGIMASGRPALFVGPEQCESAEAIRDAGCGVVVDPAVVASPGVAVVETLRRWASADEERARLGRAGREAFLARYERVRNCDEFETVIQRAWGAPGAMIESPSTPIVTTTEPRIADVTPVAPSTFAAARTAD